MLLSQTSARLLYLLEFPPVTQFWGVSFWFKGIQAKQTGMASLNPFKEVYRKQKPS